MAATAPSLPVSVSSARHAAALEIVRTHTLLAAGSHFIPVPFLDSVAVAGVQLRMMSELAAHYGHAFDRDRGRAFIAALGTGVAHELVPRTALAGLLGDLVLRVPLLGGPLRLLTWPALMATITHFLGKAYVKHYEAGGRFGDFQLAGPLHNPVIHPAG
jgi:uncharacterized protein (DUF697 family)